MAGLEDAVTISIAPREPPHLGLEYVRAVRAAAASWEGRGEIAGSNNRGPAIDEMLAIAGVGQRDEDGHSLGGAWCGVGASAMLALGARAMGWARPPMELHAGAKRLARNVGEWGRYVVRPRGWTLLGGGTYRGELDVELMAVALAVVWHRGTTRETSWQGHVEIPERYDPETDTLVTRAPNVAPRRAVRKRLIAAGHVLVPGQAVWHLRGHSAGSWRRKLYGIAAAP
jgi:hypothetical protein